MSMRMSPPPVENIPDLILAYQMMSFDMVVLELFKYAKTCNPSDELLEKIRYMELNYYIQKRDYHLALSISNEMKLMDLDQDKLLEINYVEGSILSQLKRFKEAMECFKRVYEVNKNYRQIKERIKEIEKD